MPKDRDQLTPADPEDAAHLATARGQGTGGSGRDLLPEEGGPTDAPADGGEEAGGEVAPGRPVD
jgi:hypothetical protein